MSKFQVSTSINTPTVNGYPADSTLCIIEGSGVVAHIFVEPDGRLVVATNRPDAIDIRQEDVRKNLTDGDYFRREVDLLDSINIDGVVNGSNLGFRVRPLVDGAALRLTIHPHDHNFNC
ncbi:hypothetical protein [Klebsiella quasipneumoniae]|uniref:hypothetical protein n=1 Tax=Klebsiella quasipneumoniae TaxID=1463165 RepID=UPI000CCA5D0B|nr:hypothetical protein [Klebsiella quasipneumoniae]PLJ65524.1 hypothetical protein B6J68_03750 [Klebsiella quasipneumoniae]